MALEDLTGTKYIDSLNSANPVAADDFVDGTSHLQGIKNVLKTTFPNLNGAVTATPADLNATSSLATDYAPYAHSHKNRVINGCFRVWERHITFISIANGDYCADRWKYVYTGTGDANIARNAASASDTQHSLVWHCTAVDASVAASDACGLKYHIEGTDIQDFNLGTADAATVTLSFKHKHTLTGTYCVSFRNDAADRSYIAEYTQSVSDTWETAEITLTLDTTGTWLYSEGEIGLKLQWAFQSGSTYNTTAGTWQAGSYFATSSQVNALSSTSNYCRLADVQLELSSSATAFDRRSYAEEVALCQRYYEKSYGLDTHAGAVAQFGMEWGYISGIATAAHSYGASVRFNVLKAVLPTVTGYSPNSGTAGYAHDYTAATDVAVTLSSKGTSSFRWSTISLSAASVNLALQWVAEAEI